MSKELTKVVVRYRVYVAPNAVWDTDCVWVHEYADESQARSMGGDIALHGFWDGYNRYIPPKDILSVHLA